MLHADEKRLHAFVYILKDGRAMATLEQMLLHVNMTTGRGGGRPVGALQRQPPPPQGAAGLLRVPDTAASARRVKIRLASLW
ncbi:hypothetical protein U879_19880 [Defluviimonas sp. 20V17]|nr:hypothetical protein U879_19880 [Defluviimonas sp. 20V17]